MFKKDYIIGNYRDRGKILGCLLKTICKSSIQNQLISRYKCFKNILEAMVNHGEGEGVPLTVHRGYLCI